MDPETAVAMTFGLVILAGAGIIISGMRYRSRAMEMAHRERLAMIERGISPPLELGAAYTDRQRSRGGRFMSLGIVIIGLGFALALLIGFTAREGEVAIGIGGAVVAIGLALVATSIVVHSPAKDRDEFFTTSRPIIDRPAPPPADRRDPPSA